MTFRYPSTVSLPTPIAASRRRLAIITDNIGLPNGSAKWVGINASPTAQYGQNCWWVWGLAILNWPYELVAISSGSTRTCAQAATAFAAEVTAFAPQEIWISLGRNDMTSAATATTALASIDTIIAAALAINPNMPIKISTVIPGDTTTQTTAYQQASSTFNYGLKRRAQTNQTVQLIDMAAVLRDPAQTSGRALSGYISGDTINPTASTHYLMGVYWAADIAGTPAVTIRAMGDQDYFGTNTNSKQLVQNPTFAGSGGSSSVLTSGVVTGTIPANWNVTSEQAITAAVQAVTQDTTPWPRSWLPITLSGTATAAAAVNVTGGMPDSPSIVTLGTTLVRTRVAIKTASLTNVAQIVLRLQGFDSGFATTPVNMDIGESSATGQTTFPTLFHLEIPAFVPPTGVVHWQMVVAIQVNSGATPSGTLSISSPVVEVVV